VARSRAAVAANYPASLGCWSPPWHESPGNKKLLVAQCHFDVAYRRMSAAELENDHHALRDNMKPGAASLPMFGVSFGRN
jgi:hypothetical protein